MAIWKTRLKGDEPDVLATWFEWLRDHLSDQFYIWHLANPRGISEPIDLVVLHPVAGIWVAAIRDWDTAAIQGGTGDYVQVGGEESGFREAHPLRQAADQATGLREILERHPHLVFDQGQKAGQLRLAVHHLVLLPNVREADLREAPLKRLFQVDQVIEADLLDRVADKKRTIESVFLEKRNLVHRFANPGGLSPGQLTLITSILAGQEISLPDPSEYPAAARHDEEEAERVAESPRDDHLEDAEPATPPSAPSPARKDALSPRRRSSRPKPTPRPDSEPADDRESDDLPPVAATAADVGEVRDPEPMGFADDGDEPAGAPPAPQAVAPDRPESPGPSLTFAAQEEDGPEPEPVSEDPGEEDPAPARANPALPDLPDSPDALAERFAGKVVPSSLGEAMDIAMLESLKYIVDLNDQLLQRMWTRP